MTSNNKYQMWITFNGEKEKIRLPVLPEKVKISMGTNDQSVDVAGLGEILIAQSRKATEFSFSSFFPAAAFPGIAVQYVTKPSALRDKLIEWKNSDKPVHLIITGLDIDVYCRITKFVPTEEGGDVGTVHYDISFKEYREPKVRQVKVEISTKTATVQQNTARTDNTTPTQTYTVKKGDCLWNIAKKYLGSGAKYMTIFNLNKGILKNPNLIYPGQVLRLK
ncbi:MAG: LysM peptidoglycan-binding domain-containing protein [Clostridia bacterium]|nr:LysM peptidoglycan-binding domain-containing protein [Clostridia bacterium]